MRNIENVRAYIDIIAAIANNDKETLEKIRTDYKGFGTIKSAAINILHYTNLIQSKIDNKDPLLTCFNEGAPKTLDDIKIYKHIMKALYTYDRASLSNLNINFYDIDAIKIHVESILRSVDDIEKTLDLGDHFLKCYNEHYRK